MPLTAVDFYPKGPVKSADMNQFYNLFTGVMNDQPVTFSNALSVGGQQGVGTVPLKLYGAVGQSGHLLDLYADRTQAQPGFGFDALGSFGWGPGGTAPQDTFLSRIATQGHAADTPGLLITPQLEVGGGILAHGNVTWPSGGAIGDDGAGGINVGVNLSVESNLYVGFDRQQWFHEIRPSVIGAQAILSTNGADPWAAGLTFAEAMLVSRGADLADVAGSWSMPLSAHCFGGNWLQFNVHFYKVTAGVGWPGTALFLDYDVDTTNAAGGRISMLGGKVGINGIASGSGSQLQVFGDITASGSVIAGANVSVGGGTLYFGGGANDTWIQRNGVSSWQTNSNVGISGALFIGGAPVELTSAAGVAQLRVIGGDILLDASRSFTWSGAGGEIVAAGETVSRAGTVYISPHAYIYFNLGVGHTVTCQSLIQTSDPALKSSAVVMADADCMTRIRGNVPVYSYVLDPPSPPPSTTNPPNPTPTDIGFMATDVHANSPEFSGLDDQGNPIGVNYANMAALLWGALRSLDARCQAKGI